MRTRVHPARVASVFNDRWEQTVKRQTIQVLSPEDIIFQNLHYSTPRLKKSNMKEKFLLYTASKQAYEARNKIYPSMRLTYHYLFPTTSWYDELNDDLKDFFFDDRHCASLFIYRLVPFLGFNSVLLERQHRLPRRKLIPTPYNIVAVKALKDPYKDVSTFRWLHNGTCIKIKISYTEQAYQGE